MNGTKITGAREIRDALRKLPKELQRAAEKAVLRAGAQPIAKAAKARAPKDSGLLKKSIGLRVATVKGETSARVGPRTGMKRQVTRKRPNGKTYTEMADPNNYSHLVELGSSRAPAKPFIRPAVDAAASDTLAAMATGYEKHLTKVVAKLRKR